MNVEEKKPEHTREDEELMKLASQVLASKANEILLGTGVSWDEAMREAKRRLR